MWRQAARQLPAAKRRPNHADCQKTRSLSEVYESGREGEVFAVVAPSDVVFKKFRPVVSQCNSSQAERAGDLNRLLRALFN